MKEETAKLTLCVTLAKFEWPEITHSYLDIIAFESQFAMSIPTRLYKSNGLAVTDAGKVIVFTNKASRSDN